MNKAINDTHTHAAILAVIERETERFVAGDFDAWAELWVQDDRTREVCFSPIFGATVLEGWDKIEPYMREVFAAGAVCDIVDFKRTKMSVTLAGDLAFVTFDGASIQSDTRVDHTFETRCLERQGGNWRILYSSFVLRGHQRNDEDRMAIDAAGHVLCAPEKAMRLLKDHPGLQISNGQLRASRRDWDTHLQAAIKCAAEQHGYFQQYRHVAKSGHSFRLPVVLGETDSGGVAYCTLFVRDEMTFVEFQSDQNLTERLDIARAIYGLSDGQLALAHRIVCGDSLGAAATLLGVSINTVRTHLSRIYVKTGVNSQTALVRALLSVG